LVGENGGGKREEEKLTSAKMMGKFLQDRDCKQNHIYIGLQVMSKLARLSSTTNRMLKQHRDIVTSMFCGEEGRERREERGIMRQAGQVELHDQQDVEATQGHCSEYVLWEEGRQRREDRGGRELRKC
jgi:hypothetical protein